MQYRDEIYDTFDVEIDYEINFICSQGKMILNFYLNDNNQTAVMDNIEGLVTINDNKWIDVLFADSQEVIWLSEIIDSEYIDNTSWKSLKKWISKGFSKVKNVIIKGLRLTLNVAVNIVGIENGAKTLSMYKDSYGDYHANFDCWQAYAGYMDLYDFVFNLGSSMMPSKNEFYDTNNDGIDDYILWGWKGDYWELGAGGELGIYKRLGDSSVWYVDKKLAIYMSLKVEYRKYLDQNWATIIDWNPSDYYQNEIDKQQQWWITGFDPKYANKGVTQDQLKVTFEVRFITKGYDQDFNDKLKMEFKTKWTDRYAIWSYDNITQTFTYSY